MISPTTLALGSSLPSTADFELAGLGSILLPPTPCSTISLRSYFAARSSAGPSSLRSCALLMPTDEPRLAGFTKTGYLSAASICAMALRGEPSHSRAQQRDVFHNGQTGLREQALHHVLVHARRGAQHARADIGDAGQFKQSLNRAVFAEGAVQNRKNHVECALLLQDLEGRARAPAASESPRAAASPRASPQDRRHAGCAHSAAGRLRAAVLRRAAASQRPSLVMPMGTTSNFLRSIAFRIEAAESSETSCSPLRPPNRIPTRSFFAIGLIVAQKERKEVTGKMRGSPNPKISSGRAVSAITEPYLAAAL